MNDKRNKQHFGEPKKINTQIKHHILSNTLNTSLSIANNLCKVYKTDKVYTYIDLFAGRGVFEDYSKGSPLIAIDLLSQHNESGKNNFNDLQIVCTEKDDKNYCDLQRLLIEYPDENITCYSGSGEWESFSAQIQSILKDSGWGFIFADPYSTELDIESLKNALQSYSKLKDILVFFNFRTLARQDGRKYIQDIDRICKNIGINASELLDADENFSEIFEYKIKEHFKDLKKFVIGVGFPTTVKGQLINSDYFYLIFSTNTPVLVDAFLDSYEEMLEKYTNYSVNQQMPLFGNPDKNYIFDVLKTEYSGGCTLYDLYKHITDKFLSWKELTKTIKKVPTIKNVVSILNEFYNEGSIKYIANNDVFYKKNSKHGYEGNLRYSEAGKSADNMKNIRICLNSR